MSRFHVTPFHKLPPWEARKVLARQGVGAIAGLGLAPEQQLAIDIMGPAFAIASRALPTLIRTIPLPDHIETVRASVLQLEQAENASIETTNAYIRRHNAGRMLPAEYAEYDGLRHSIHDAQVRYHQALRQACYDSFGRTVGDQIIARVPYPGWFPRLDRPNMPLVNGDSPALQGLASLGVAPAIPPLALAIIILGVIAGIALVVHEVTKFVDATSDAMIARAQASTLQRIVEQREASYQACIQAGQPPSVCAQQAQALTADLADDLHELMRMSRVRRMRRALGGIGAILALAGAIGLGVFIYRKRHRIAGSLTGLGRLGSGKKRRRRKKKRASTKKRTRGSHRKKSHSNKRRTKRGVRGMRGGLGSATRLTSLNDNVPSRYMLEV